MRILFIITLVIAATACSKTRDMHQAMHSQSKINPLFKAKNINDKFGGDSVKLRIVMPLSQSTLGHYDVEDILAPTCYKEDQNYEKCLKKLKQYEDNHNIPDEQKKWWYKFQQGMKFNVYNLAIQWGYSSKLKYTFDYEFPELPIEYFKQIRIKKLFFALEDCDKDDLGCTQRQKEKPTTFNFLEKFFMNVSVIQNHDPLDFIDNPFTTPTKKQFSRFSDNAFGQRLGDFNDARLEAGFIPEEYFYDLNIARLDNSQTDSTGNRYNLRSNGKTFIFTVDKNYIQQAKKFFDGKHFEGIISNITLIGKKLYVDLHSSSLQEQFFNKINQNVDDMSILGIHDYKGCSELTCKVLNVNDINLVPMLEKSYHFKFDTFFDIKHLDYNDFKYNGYLELEIELDLPI